MKKLNFVVFIVLQTIAVSHSILQEELGKDLPSNYNNDDIVSRKRHPLFGGGAGAGAASSGCNFNGVRKPKVDGTGRTFFDLQFVNVGYNENYNINCGGSGGHPTGGGGNKPLGDFGQKPGIHQHKPILGGLHHQGGQQASGDHNQGGGGLANRPFLSMLLANRPLQGLFSQSQSQSQSQSGVFSDVISGFTELLPKPQDIGQGFGEGISSFIQTLPQIGQSFQSLLPSFDNFQFPSLPSLPSPPQGGQASGPSAPTTQPPKPMVPTGPDPIDPDDIIYNDDIKPVHEDHDLVTDPYTNNKLPPGAYYSRNYEQNRYQALKNYQNQKIINNINPSKYHFQQRTDPNGRDAAQFRQIAGRYRQYEGRSLQFGEERRSSGRGFRFPS